MTTQILKLCLFFYWYHNALLAKANISKSNSLTNPWGSKSMKLEEDTDEYLIDTPGCTIPNIWKEHQIVEANDCRTSCGKRAVFVDKLNDDSDQIQFTINKYRMQKIFEENAYECCSQFAYRLSSSDTIAYSQCKPFINGTKAILEEEVITVTCKLKENSLQTNLTYEDAYIVLKKMQRKVNNNNNNNYFNVLMVGMDSMSRARAIQSMPEVFEYLKLKSWLDYRGYQKAKSNTLPNLMILHTGKNTSTFHLACKNGMDYCNDIMIWSKFKRSGYFTAYGEDRLPDTYENFFEFKESPTDHYTRPLFLIGNKKIGNIACLKRRPSAHYVLDYAYQFVKAYKNEKFFGFFWLVSYSHDPNNSPTLLQNQLLRFFQNIDDTGALNNTIIIFFGDHGTRYGRLKLPVESYYDERLPMLFMWFPYSFRERYKAEFNNLEINQHRLTTHCDLHSTLWNILKLSDKSVKIVPPEVCPLCTSLFQEKSIHRRCEHMEVSIRWCSCQALNEVHSTDIAATLVPEILLFHLCKGTGVNFQIKTVLRHHWFRQEYDYKDNITYYVIAIEMVQNDIQYEAIIKKQQFNFEIIDDIDTISPRDPYIDVSGC